MKTVFDEQYGEISISQRAAYKKYNVSPCDHEALVEKFGEDNHEAITAAVKKFSTLNMFSAYKLWNES